MTGPTHAVIGLAATVLLAKAGGLHPDAVDLLCVLLGSLAPDIDADEGSITRPGKIFGRLLPRGASKVLDGLFQTLSGVIRFFFKHRSVFHWPLIGIVLFIVGLAYGKLWLAWFGWGYLWHVLADYCTKQGVPILGPFSKQNYSLNLVKTGSFGELVICLGVAFLTCYFGWSLLPVETRDGFRQIGGVFEGREKS